MSRPNIFYHLLFDWFILYYKKTTTISFRIHFFFYFLFLLLFLNEWPKKKITHKLYLIIIFFEFHFCCVKIRRKKQTIQEQINLNSANILSFKGFYQRSGFIRIKFKNLVKMMKLPMSREKTNQKSVINKNQWWETNNQLKNIHRHMYYIKYFKYALFQISISREFFCFWIIFLSLYFVMRYLQRLCFKFRSVEYFFEFIFKNHFFPGSTEKKTINFIFPAHKKRKGKNVKRV